MVDRAWTGSDDFVARCTDTRMACRHRMCKKDDPPTRHVLSSQAAVPFTCDTSARVHTHYQATPQPLHSWLYHSCRCRRWVRSALGRTPTSFVLFAKPGSHFAVAAQCCSCRSLCHRNPATWARRFMAWRITIIYTCRCCGAPCCVAAPGAHWLEQVHPCMWSHLTQTLCDFMKTV